jgi:hypothetical protein
LTSEQERFARPVLYEEARVHHAVRSRITRRCRGRNERSRWQAYGNTQVRCF